MTLLLYPILWASLKEHSRLNPHFYKLLSLLPSHQRVPRTGWVYRNVEKPESVSDHMYRMAVMALVTKDEHLNKDR